MANVRAENGLEFGALQEAWELVEDELLSEKEFAEFVWHNDAEMLLAANPQFFEATALADQARKLR